MSRNLPLSPRLSSPTLTGLGIILSCRESPMANRRNRPRRSQRSRTRFQTQSSLFLPFVRIPRLPSDPPSFVQVPPWRRTVQVSVPSPATGSSVSLHASDVLISGLYLSGFRAFIIARVRVWSSASSSSRSTLSVVPGSESASSNPVIEYADVGPIGVPAKIGYHPRGAYAGPWAGDWVFVKVSSSSFPLLVEVRGIFL